MVRLGEALQRAAALDHDAALEQPPCRHDLDHGHGEAERAGAGDDQDGNGNGHRAMQVVGRHHPADEGRECGDVDHGRIEARGPIGQAPVTRAACFGRFHHTRHLGQERVAGHRRRLDRERARHVERAGLEQRAGCHRPWQAFARYQRDVEVRPPLDDPGIDRDTVARRQQEGHARPDCVDGQIVPCAIGFDHPGAARRQRGQSLDRRARPLAHDMIERAADQQEEQQRDRGVEISMRSVMDGLVEAHAEGQKHADRDRHVHVGPAAADRLPG